MSTAVFTLATHTAGADVYARLFDSAGRVFDFSDGAFTTLGGATTPYVAATERTEMDGTSYSGYQVSVDLSAVNDTPTAKRYTLKWYANASPADADVAIADGGEIIVQASELGELALIAQPELSVKSTAGTTAQVSLWLERGGQMISVGSVGGTVFTAATDDVITSTAHGLSDDDRVLLTTSDTLPAGLSAGTAYFVRDATTNTFKVAATSGGTAIDVTDTGTGIHKWHKPTGSVTVREHGSGSNLFSLALNAGDLQGGGIFEAEQASPAFTDDRQYLVTASVSIGGTTYTSTHSRVVIG